MRAYTFAFAALVALASNASAAASSGCDAINGGALNLSMAYGGTPVPTTSVTDFAVGETLTIDVVNTGGSLSLLAGPVGMHTVILSDQGTGTYQYVFSGANDDITLLRLQINAPFVGNSIAVTMTCAAPVPADSSILDAQRALTGLVASGASRAFEAGVFGALDASFENQPRIVIRPGVLAYAGNAGDPSIGGDPKDGSPGRAAWSVWGALRHTGTAGHAGAEGSLLTGLAGVTYSPTDALRLGGFAGAEGFGLSQHDVGLAGGGFTVGTYTGLATEQMSFKGLLAWSRLAYSLSAESEEAKFDADRFISSVEATAHARLFDVLFAPTARLRGIWERQAAWTLGGENQDARSFIEGEASFGASFEWRPEHAGLSWVPRAGVFGDYRFSGGDIRRLPDGLSLRVSSSVGLMSTSGMFIDVGGEAAGLGQGWILWSMTAQAGVRF